MYRHVTLFVESKIFLQFTFKKVNYQGVAPTPPPFKNSATCLMCCYTMHGFSGFVSSVTLIRASDKYYEKFTVILIETLANIIQFRSTCSFVMR